MGRRVVVDINVLPTLLMNRTNYFDHVKYNSCICVVLPTAELYFLLYFNYISSKKVAVYQEKLKELEDRQSELITENMDLKELCLYLDQERLRTSGDRDEGDGSSNGTITGPEDGLASPTAVETSGSVTPTPATSIGNYPTSKWKI